MKIDKKNLKQLKAMKILKAKYFFPIEFFFNTKSIIYFNKHPRNKPYNTINQLQE